MGLLGFHLDVIINPCHIRELNNYLRKRLVRASQRKWPSRAWPRSARIAELNLDTTRTPEQPSTSLPGTVDKIIPSPGPSQPEKAQIAVEGADHRYRGLRIENTLTDEHGDDVRLKKGAHVEVTITSEPEDVSRHN